MASDLLLGIDIGTTNCKAILFDLQGRLIAGGSAPTPTYHPRPEWFEHDPEQLWQTVVTTIRQALIGIDPKCVRGLTVASMGESGTMVDAHGRALCPMIVWHDARTVPEMRRWCTHFDQRRADAITAMPVRPIFTLFKLQWIRDNWPDAYRRPVRWLFTADYIAFRLCGEQATDYSLASRSLMLDLRARCWSDEILEAAGLRSDLLPTLRPAGVALGGVTQPAAVETGLHAGTMVGVGGHDHIVGALAAGVVRAGQCLDSLGTAEATFLPLDAAPPVETAHATGCTFGAHVAHERVFLLDGLLSGGASVGWIRSILTPNARDFTALEQLANSTPPGSRGALFLPRIAAGEQGGFAGLTLACGSGEMARAVYEGLAFGWRELLERAETTLGLRVERIRVIGGGARSATWTRIKADVLNRPLELLDLEEGVALGAAMLGGLAAGAYRDEAEALAEVQLAGQMLHPNHELTAFYEQIYQERFLPLRPALEWLNQ